MNKIILIVIIVLLVGTGVYVIMRNDDTDTVPALSPIVGTNNTSSMVV